MLSFSLGFILGFLGGLYLGIWITGRVLKKKAGEEVTRETINSIVNGKAPKGDFIRVNKVEEYVKTHDGEIKLGDVLEDDQQ